MLSLIHTFNEYVSRISTRYFELGLIAVERPCYLCKYMKIIAKNQLISQKYLLVDYWCRKRHLGRSRYMRVAGLSNVKNSICVLALSSARVYSSNDTVPNDNNYSITAFKLFVMSLNCFTWFKIIISVSC